jgi:hypothetical protein
MPANHDTVVRALEHHRGGLESLDGVAGVAIGRTSLGEEAIMVYVIRPEAAGPLPSQIEGIPVEVVVTGPIDAL